MRIYLFMILFTTVFLLLTLYIDKRLLKQLHISSKIKTILRFFLYFNLVGVFGYFYARYEPGIDNWLYFLFTIPIGVIFLFFCTTIFYDIGHFFLKRASMEDSKKMLYKKSLDFGALFLAFGLVCYSLYEARFVSVEKVNVKINNLAQPYSIVQLTDIHIGGLINQSFIKELVQKVNAMQPDLVVITGDLVDIDIHYAKDALQELKNLRSKYGTYFVVGNHEYFHNVDKIINEVNALGIKTLENENIYIGDQNKGFNLVGVYDVMGYRANYKQPDFEKAIANIDQNSPTILLAHQPKYIEEVHSVDLMLSGHTHGGQIYPFRFLVKLAQPYLSGLYTHNEQLQIYINKGTGFWGPPMRLGARSEITYLTLQ